MTPDQHPKVFAIVRNGDLTEARVVHVYSWTPNAVADEMKRWAERTTGTQKFEVYECALVRKVDVGFSFSEAKTE